MNHEQVPSSSEVSVEADPTKQFNSLFAELYSGTSSASTSHSRHGRTIGDFLKKNPVIDRDRWFIGYRQNRNLKRGKERYMGLLLRAPGDSDIARVYKIVARKSEGIDQCTFVCPCRQKLTMVESSSGRQLYGDARNCIHECESASFKELFPVFKSWATSSGTVNVAAEFEQPKNADSVHFGYEKVAKRDWFFGSGNGRRRRFLFVRDDGKRQFAYQYQLQSAKDSEMLYSCVGCEPEERAVVIVDNLPPNLKVVFKPPQRVHSITCWPQLVAEYASEREIAPSDHQEKEVYRIVPSEDWDLGYSASGHANDVLIIRNETDKTLCRIYSIVKEASYKSKLCFACQECGSPHFAFYLNGKEAQVQALADADHNCASKSYESVIRQQEQYLPRLRNPSSSTNAADVFVIPLVRRDNYILNEARNALYIKSFNHQFAHLFKIMEESPWGLRCTISLRCISCQCTAFIRRKSAIEESVRSYSDHDPLCPLIPIKECSFDDPVLFSKETANVNAIVGCVPKLRNGQFFVNKDLTELVILSSAYKDSGFSFQILDRSQRGERRRITFKCINCDCLAYYRCRGIKSTVVRSFADHQPNCKPLALTECVLQGKPFEIVLDSDSEAETSGEAAEVCDEMVDDEWADWSGRTAVDPARVQFSKSKNELFIKCEVNPAFCYGFITTEKDKNEALLTETFVCVACPLRVHVQNIAEKSVYYENESNHEPTCHPFPFDESFLDESMFDKELGQKTADVTVVKEGTDPKSPSTVADVVSTAVSSPPTPRRRFGVNTEQTEMFVVSKNSDKHANKFVISTESDATKTFKCVSCPATASFSQEDAMNDNCDPVHESACRPIPVEDCVFYQFGFWSSREVVEANPNCYKKVVMIEENPTSITNVYKCLSCSFVAYLYTDCDGAETYHFEKQHDLACEHIPRETCSFGKSNLNWSALGGGLREAVKRKHSSANSNKFIEETIAGYFKIPRLSRGSLSNQSPDAESFQNQTVSEMGHLDEAIAAVSLGMDSASRAALRVQNVNSKRQRT